MADLSFLISQIMTLMTPVLLAAIAGAICDRAGVFNLALEGKMLFGAFVAMSAASLLGSTGLAVPVAMVLTLLFALPMAYGVTRLNGDPVVIGIGINLLAVGLTAYLLTAIFGVRGTYFDLNVFALPRFDIPLIKDVPVLGAVFSGHGLLTYVSWFVVFISWFMLFRTPWGLRLRGVGLAPEAAIALGADPAKYKFYSIVIAGLLCGLAGADLALGTIAQFAENMTAGRGWIAVVAVMLGRSHPLYVALACALFGLGDAIGVRLQGAGLPNQITDIAPYAITIIALVLLALKGRKNPTLHTGNG